MIITIQFFERINKKRIVKEFSGNTAKECMNAINEYRENHNLAIYTRTEIINVQD